MQNIHILRIAICFMTIFFTTSFVYAETDRTEYQPDIALGVTDIPQAHHKTYHRLFNRYTEVIAPNGKSIRIYAQSRLRNEQIIRCRHILEHYLTDLPGSKFGKDKAKIANAMANNNAQLLLLNGSDDGRNEVDIMGQPLYKEEIQVEGHHWYMNQAYEGHRDAAYEEILHLVHDTGIGVDGLNTLPGAAPEFQQDIRQAQIKAIKDKRWGVKDQQWIRELKRENSLSQEYLAAVIDAYYGLWGAWDENSDASMWGLYHVRDRDAMKTQDALAYQLTTEFFHPYLTYNARIDKNLNGLFSLRYNPKLPYTNHSRYLKDITLLGDHDVDVVINAFDNHITGNAGKNKIIFSGKYEEYEITKSDVKTIIQDLIHNRDGRNTVINVEALQFSDRIVNLQ